MFGAIFEFLSKVISLALVWLERVPPKTPEEKVLAKRRESQKKLTKIRRDLRRRNYEKVSRDIVDLLGDVDVLRRTKRGTSEGGEDSSS